MRKYLTLLVAVLGAVAAAVAAAVTDGNFTNVEKIQVGIQAATAVAVWLAANVPALTVAKAAVAALLAALNLATGLIVDGMQTADWWQLIVAALTALGVLGTNGFAPKWSGPPVEANTPPRSVRRADTGL